MAKQTKKTEKPTLPPQEALYQAISLCRKAGALTMGFDAVEDACVKGKAWLVMTASDASAKTVQRLNYAVGDLVDVITMPLTQCTCSPNAGRRTVCRRARMLRQSCST